MQLFKGKLKFLTLTTIGLIYDITGVAIITLLYKPVIPHKGMWVGNLYGALYNPDTVLPAGAMYLISIGFICLLFDHLLGIYKPKEKIAKILIKILVIFLSLYILTGIIQVLIKTAVIIVTKYIS